MIYNNGRHPSHSAAAVAGCDLEVWSLVLSPVLSPVPHVVVCVELATRAAAGDDASRLDASLEKPSIPRSGLRLSHARLSRSFASVPHGGTLVDRMVKDSAEQEALVAGADISIEVTERQSCDVEMLVNGGLSPLEGFMTEDVYSHCVDNMRLPGSNVRGGAPACLLPACPADADGGFASIQSAVQQSTLQL